MNAPAKTCPTGKVVLTRKLAKKKAKRTGDHYTQAVVPYVCKECGQWHIGTATSRPKGPMKIIHKPKH